MPRRPPRGSRSPMCWERKASRRARRRTRSSARRRRRGRAARRPAAERRGRVAARAAASGSRCADDRVLAAAVDRPVVGEERVCDAGRAAPRASSSSMAIGSSARLPLVITRGRAVSASSRWWSGVYGSITPSHGVPGATSGATGASARRRSEDDRAGGGAQQASSAASDRRARAGRAPSPRTAFPRGACARAARATAASSPASQARW